MYKPAVIWGLSLAVAWIITMILTCHAYYHGGDGGKVFLIATAAMIPIWAIWGLVVFLKWDESENNNTT